MRKQDDQPDPKQTYSYNPPVRRRTATAEELEARYSSATQRRTSTTEGRPVLRRTTARPVHVAEMEEEDEQEYDDPTPPKGPTSTLRRTYAPETRRLPERHSGWLVWLVLCVLLIGALGWLVVSAVGAWWHGVQENLSYGMPRTFQTDQYVGLGDSQTYPDHFTALNLNGLIVVVQINPTNAKADAIYYVTRNNDSTTPVTLSFRDVNHDGRIDMLIKVGDDQSSYTIVFFNNGKQFVGQPS